MEWNSKWDFTEFESGTIPNVDSNNGSGGFCVDLKLGQVIDSGNGKMALSPSGSSKRARPVNNSIHGAICLVDGCKADLSKCKEYHRRHKVCEVHSKTPEVLINGQKQRFCQQCSRFHSLEEFDEGKRSCRKRLDGHNRRRRKPQPDTSRAASLFSTYQGTTMLQFASPHVYQAALTNPLLMSMGDNEPSYLTRANKQNPYPESSSGPKKAPGKPQFSLFSSGSHLKLNHQTSPPKVCQQHILSFDGGNYNNNNSNSNSNSSSYDKLFCNGYPPPGRVVQQPVVQADCALSLLSSSPSQTSCTTLSHVMQPSNSFSATPNPLDPSAGYGGLESIMDHSGSDCNEMIQMGMQNHDHHGSRDDGVPQTLPFYWE